IRDITLRHFPAGFTILNADGAWFDPARQKFIEEESRQVLVCPTRRGQLREWCDELGTALGQKELLVMEVGRATAFRPRGARGRSALRPQRALCLVERCRGDLVGPRSYVAELRSTIRRVHRCEASHTRTEPVKETIGEKVLWEGNVEVF